MKIKGKYIRLLAAALLLPAAAVCIGVRLPECFGIEGSAALAAAFTLSDGAYRTQAASKAAEETTQPESSELASQSAEETSTAPNGGESAEERDKSGYYDSYADREGEEKYSIISKTYGADGTRVASCYVKNHTSLDVDFEALLNKPLTFEVTDDGSAQVLIYHTHTCESYLDESVDYFFPSYYSRTQISAFNVTSVGDAISDALNEKGIKTMHDTTVHDSTYNGAYSRSLQTVNSITETHTDIKVVIDIHRDAIGSDTEKTKAVFTYDGVCGAQIMILAGCDPDGGMGFENWENNLSFALKLQNTAEEMYPGMTRPLDFGYFAYNEPVCDGSLLIEVGTDANSIDEAVYSGTLLANVLYEVLSEN